MPSKSKLVTRRNNWTSVDDAVTNGILSVLSKKRNVKNWSGTMTELQAALVVVLGKKNSEGLPGSPGALRLVVNRVINRLRSRSISVRFIRTPDHARTRVVKFSR